MLNAKHVFEQPHSHSRCTPDNETGCTQYSVEGQNQKSGPKNKINKKIARRLRSTHNRQPTSFVEIRKCCVGLWTQTWRPKAWSWWRIGWCGFGKGAMWGKKDVTQKKMREFVEECKMIRWSIKDNGYGWTSETPGVALFVEVDGKSKNIYVSSPARTERHLGVRRDRLERVRHSYSNTHNLLFFCMRYCVLVVLPLSRLSCCYDLLLFLSNFAFHVFLRYGYVFWVCYVHRNMYQNRSNSRYVP